jgi:hypothetical protein
MVTEFGNRISRMQKRIDEMKASNTTPNEILIEEHKLERLKEQQKKLQESIADIKAHEKDKRLQKTYNGN